MTISWIRLQIEGKKKFKIDSRWQRIEEKKRYWKLNKLCIILYNTIDVRNKKKTNVFTKELIIENRKIYNNITKDNHHPNRIKKKVIKIFNECIIYMWMFVYSKNYH